MLQLGSALKGYAIKASDGRIGAINDILFDEETWKVRWLLIDTGGWLTGRKVLLHPSVIGVPDEEQREITVTLTKAQIEAGPNLSVDHPLSRQMQGQLYDFYKWAPPLGDRHFGATPNAIASAFSSPPIFGGDDPIPEDGDPHLRSLYSVTGYQVKANDGEIGHIEDFLVDETSWDIRYLLIDTKNWWPSQHVLISPIAVKNIDLSDEEFQISVSRDQVQASPRWPGIELFNLEYAKLLHLYYDWPGYGWE